MGRKDFLNQGYFSGGEAAMKKKFAALNNHLNLQLFLNDESMNFADEVFTSVVNQLSDLVTAFLIMKGTKEILIKVVAMQQRTIRTSLRREQSHG